ncbi:MAG: hypothetical protein HY663_06145 [Chloroflexi bacterium]|nr:hypothetical protein [Chloroflexota bacterium]
MKPTIQITVVDDSRVEQCDAECGLDWSSAEVRALASQSLQGRFGENIELAYLDLAEAAPNRRTLALSQEIKGKNLLLPLLTINGQIRISGDFDIRQLLDAIEAEMEIEG